METITFQGSEQLRYRFIIATLMKKPIVIVNIREDDENPGLRDYEKKYIDLIKRVSSGCKVDINETGTRVAYKPGKITGGTTNFDCGLDRGMGYYIMGILPIVLFGNKPTTITFTGITNNSIDISVDIIRIVTLPLLKHWGVDENCFLRIKKRGLEPLGGGEVLFTCPTMKYLSPVELTNSGVVKSIRGVAYTVRVNSSEGIKVGNAARDLFHNFLNNVAISNDHYAGESSGKSPGYGVTLLAVTTEGFNYAAEMMRVEYQTAEELGTACSELLLEEIARGGCIDSIHQPLAILLLAFSQASISKIRTGPLTVTAVKLLRLLKDMVGIVFRLQPAGDEGGVMISCLGSGYENSNRGTT